MATHLTALDPDAPLTLRALEREIRAHLPAHAPGIGGKTLAREIRAGRLRAARVGKWWRVTWRAYLEWLDAQRVEPAPPTQNGDAAAWAARRIADEETRAVR